MRNTQIIQTVSVVLICLSATVAKDLNLADFQNDSEPMKTWSDAKFNDFLAAYNEHRRLAKPMSHDDRKYGLHDGNKIRTLFYNYGSVGRPNTEPSLEWPAYSSHGYAYEFGVMVGAEVIDVDGDRVPIFSDGMLDGGDYDVTGGANWWGWEPLPGYAADGQELIAVSSDDNTWGELFPVDSDGNPQWPGQFGDGVIIADLESYYIMDDRWNREFQYYPFPDDSARRGIGVEVTVRGYQYAAAVAEDIIFIQCEVKNVSDKRLDKVVVGMIGDPHIGGAGDFSDDFAGFIDNSGFDSYTSDQADVSGMVYCWDKQGSGNDYNVPWDDLGWLGYKFLESPSLTADGIDNDMDGLVDESQSNDIDDDSDWQATDAEAASDTAEARHYYSDKMWNGIDDDNDGRIDDWGDLDGKSDDLNGNGVPDPGEPDYEYMDVDEADMIGLTSFWAPIYETEEANEDDIMWLRMTPGTFATSDEIEQDADNVFIFGSGYFALDPGESQKFSIAVIMGQGKDDLLDNAKVADWIYRLGFQFTKPPEKPKVVAVPGDRRVTLYWDDTAENSVDPVAGQDFEGYKIYRSTVKGEWGRVLTNNQGIKVGNVPIAQFDFDNGISGPHAIPSAEGYHMDMGDDTGLQRTFVDTNLINGLTYYYAVTAYDRGSVEGILTPLECAATIGGDNVVAVMPNSPALGFDAASFTNDHYQGYATATMAVSLVDPLNADPNAVVEVEVEADGNNKYVTVEAIVGDDTTLIWDEISLSQVTDIWNNSLLAEHYEIYLMDISSITLDSTTWSTAVAPVDFTIQGYPGGVAFARDLEIRFFDQAADTTVLVSPQPVNFQVWNINENQQLDIIFFDNDGSASLTLGDRIVPIIYVNGAPTGTWDLTVDDLDSTTTPAGSELNLWVSKPFGSEGVSDRYRLEFTPASVDPGRTADEMNRIAVVPNPYVASSGFETPPPQVFTYGRGDRRVDFIHLPQVCTIRVFTLVGEHVITIQHQGSVFDGSESWDLLSKDGHDIAPGIYIYHVETPDGDDKVGRLAVIK